MIINSAINSKKYINIASVRCRKKALLQVLKNNEKRLLKRPYKDRKLIYAFFLDIA